MEYLGISLIVVAVTAIVVIAILLLARRAKQEKMSRIEAMAARNGWQFEAFTQPTAGGYWLHGPGWQIESKIFAQGPDVEPHLSNMHSTTTFSALQPSLPGRNLFIGTVLPNPGLGAAGETLRQALINRALGQSGAGMREVPAGSSTFLRSFMVMANDAEDVRRLFSPRSEMLLSPWEAQKPVVRINQAGLEIHMDNVHLQDPEKIQAFIALGESFLHTWDQANR